MPKTLKGIWDDLSIHSQQALEFNDNKLALGDKEIEEKWYSDKEVDTIIEQCMSAKIHMDDFQKTGIILCPICAKEFIKVDKYSWKPDCLCFKKDLKLSVG